MTGRLRVGIVGAGRIARFVHGPILSDMSDVEVAAVCDKDRAAAASLAARLGVTQVHESSAALAADGIDAAFVLTDRANHRAVALPLIERGIPIFIEKPLANDLADAEAIADAAERAGVLIRVGYMKRFDPAVAHARALLADGSLGTPRYAVMHVFGGDWMAGARIDGQAPVFPSPIYGIDDPLQEWLEMWIHAVNLARLIFGEPSEVLAATLARPRLALLRFGGVLVHFETGIGLKRSLPWDDWAAVYGEAGIIRLDFPPLLLGRSGTRIEMRNADGTTRPSLPPVDPYAEEIRAFVDAVRAGSAPDEACAEALADMALCFAIVRKAEETRVRS